MTGQGPALIASIDRAGEHVLVLGLVVLIGVVAGLVYLAGKRRADR